MTFWIIVAIMIAIALLFVVLPLLGRGKTLTAANRSDLNLSVYRDQLRELDSELAEGALSKEQYQSARSELESRVLEDSSASAANTAAAPIANGRGMAIAAAIVVPVFSVSLYLKLGQPGETSAVSKPPPASQQITQEQINAMVDSLAQKLKQNPDDAEGWAMLGRSYNAMRRYDEAADAYARAVALMPGNAQMLTDYADILAMKNGRSMLGEPEKVIQQALQIDPNNMKAIALMGTAHFQRKNYAAAIESWQKILSMVPPDSPVAASIKANISQAQGLSGQLMAAPPGPKQGTAQK